MIDILAKPWLLLSTIGLDGDKFLTGNAQFKDDTWVFTMMVYKQQSLIDKNQ